MSNLSTIASVLDPIWEWGDKPHVFILIGVGVLLAIAAVMFFALRKKKSFMTTRELTVCAFCIALAFALSAIKIYKMPQGGSITIAGVLPLAIFAFYFGLKKGLFAGFTFSFLKLTLDPYIVHPIQLLLDYTVAYTCIGVVALFRKLKVPGLCTGIMVFAILQFLCSFLSGIVFFRSSAPDQSNIGVIAYSAGYNSVQLIDGAIAAIVAFLLTRSGQFNALLKTLSESPQKKPDNAEAVTPEGMEVSADAVPTPPEDRRHMSNRLQ
jgi:thiamine transporter